MSAALDLTEQQLERLADLLAPRIAAALSSEANAPAELLTAAEVGKRFGVTAEWVRDHCDELGAIRLGNGRRPRLRFNAEEVAASMMRRSEGERSANVEVPAPTGDLTRSRRERAGNDLDTLPIRQIKPLSTSTKAARRRANAPGPATRGVASPRQQPSSAASARPSPRRSEGRVHET